ncbi:restriction endonuclease subunit S [Selenomonas caprae]|uniref:Restriction endonuclease subunit S n=1 Tax=Selenomonas caprae TaxID=2606905 RepID=A0A5D6WKS0_9FIRM|nr:restriction endonuclease subunit S [Selenomonas caprae]TYZ28450.1 restriction endonuclease subunit S [Selenomonas caprae]
MSTPKVRFKGFTDDWEQRKLGDVIDDLKSGLSRELQLDDIGIPVVRANNVDDNKLDMKSEVKYWYKDDPQGANTSNYLIHKDDILINFINSEAKMGTAAIVEDEPLRDTIYTTNILRLRTNEELHPYFFLMETNLAEYKSFIKAITKPAVNQASFTTVDYKKYDIKIPNYKEQARIGGFFKKLENLITSYQRKCDELQKVKKYMLQKIFPKKGEKVPEIRFAGFTGDWEPRKLFDCLDSIIDFRGRTPKKLGMEWSEDGYLALSALNVKDGFIDFAQDVHYGNQDLYDKWMTGKELHKGQVLFTTEAPMGNVAQVPDERKYILSQRTIAFEVKDDIITENFLAVILRSPNVVDDLNALASGGTAKGVSQKSLEKVSFFMPSNIEEQTKIADTFSNLDNLIALHQRKHDTLKEIKKYMLQNMFPKK